MQFAPEIGQRLGIARFRPERACKPLTRDGHVAGREHEEGDDLLLSRSGETGGGAPADEKTEASEQLDAHKGWRSHVIILRSISTNARASDRMEA
jgi:hypothetical protein